MFRGRAAVCALLAFCGAARGGVMGNVRGIVHDPSHRPVAGIDVSIHAVASEFSASAATGADGAFEFGAVAAGEYIVSVESDDFTTPEQRITVTSGSAQILHFPLALKTRNESVEVTESGAQVDAEVTPVTMVSRERIDETPGADLSNSLTMITDYVPGAYMAHDQLHVRGGHQVSWAIDGVPIPNTNIASNVGPQIDPKDIDYLETQRGGYSAEYGDRTYGVFNVVPRTGFERDREVDVTTTYGSFNQTNDQINIGDHTAKFAWFASVDGNRSDYGLETPGPQMLHDGEWGLGGFVSLIYNADPVDQLRMVATARGDDYQIPNTPAQQQAGIADVERERDDMATFSWVHTFAPGVLLEVSPFVHFNAANYDGAPNDTPVSTMQHLASIYAGAQIALTATTAKHNLRVGVYGFGQSDDEMVHLVANDGTGAAVLLDKPASGHLEAGFLEDQYRPNSWLTLTGGLRATHLSGAISENAVDPRVGAAIRIPHLNWILRGFYGRYYQAPPLSTVSGPLLDYAVTQGLGFIPLRGERDEENQVGLTIPLRGWSFDTNSFRQRARNYFDHNAIGNSNLFFPLSIAGARISGLEFTMRSPQLWKRGEASIAYSYQHAEGEGAITGGLTDFTPQAVGYFFLDHDQRHTLHGNFHWTLPKAAWVSGGAYYGSGFTDGNSVMPRHLQGHTTFDAQLGKALGEKLSLGLTGLNLTNRRYLLDNSLTFGGTHYGDPRQIYLELKYKFKY